MIFDHPPPYWLLVLFLFLNHLWKAKSSAIREATTRLWLLEVDSTPAGPLVLKLASVENPGVKEL